MLLRLLFLWLLYCAVYDCYAVKLALMLVMSLQTAKDGIVSAISNRTTVNIDVIGITVNYGSNAIVMPVDYLNVNMVLTLVISSDGFKMALMCVLNVTMRSEC